MLRYLKQHLVNKTHPKKLGGQSAITQELEIYIVKTLDSLTNSEIDGFGVRCLVKAYLHQKISQIIYLSTTSGIY